MNKAKNMFAAGAVALAASSAVLVATGREDAALAQASGDYQSYSIDTVHSAAVFRIKHAGVAYQYGVFADVNGSYELDPSTGDLRELSVTVPVGKIFTGSRDRDNHLKSADFFNEREHGEITFTLDDVSNLRSNKGSGRGELTMLGETNPVEFEYEFTGSGEMRGTAKSGFHATFSIKRSDFGMNYGVDNGALGDEVTLMVGIEGNGE